MRKGHNLYVPWVITAQISMDGGPLQGDTNKVTFGATLHAALRAAVATFQEEFQRRIREEGTGKDTFPPKPPFRSGAADMTLIAGRAT